MNWRKIFTNLPRLRGGSRVARWILTNYMLNPQRCFKESQSQSKNGRALVYQLLVWKEDKVRVQTARDGAARSRGAELSAPADRVTKPPVMEPRVLGAQSWAARGPCYQSARDGAVRSGGAELSGPRTVSIDRPWWSRAFWGRRAERARGPCQ